MAKGTYKSLSSGLSSGGKLHALPMVALTQPDCIWW